MKAGAGPRLSGRIVAVTGSHAIILLDNGEGLPGGGSARSPEIGTLLKVDTTPSIALALVSALSAPMPSGSDSDQELRIVEVEFIGELPKDEIRRADDVPPRHLLLPLARRCRVAGDQGRACHGLCLRCRALDPHRRDPAGLLDPAMVKIDELLGKHFAVLGTTGTGKSCGGGADPQAHSREDPAGHILLLDLHREYAAAFREFAELVSPTA